MGMPYIDSDLNMDELDNSMQLAAGLQLIPSPLTGEGQGGGISILNLSIPYL